MSKDIIKTQPLPENLKKLLKENKEELAVGDIFFYNRDTVIRISKISKTDIHFDEADDWEGTTWSAYGSESFETFIDKVKSGTYAKVTRPFNEVMDEARKVLSGEVNIEVYYQSEYEAINDEKALIARSSKESLLAIQKGLEQKRKTAELIHKAVQFEMEKRKMEMEKLRSKLYGAVEKFEKQIKKIMRVITTIELYLGIDEELHQIQEGTKADINEPICFRQQVLFIDEEVGTYEKGGLDFRDIEKFDKWLLTGNNLDIVLPEQKGMVVLRPRRHDKEYGHPFLNIKFNIENKNNTYILVRNGECVYRIFTEKLVIADRLFPKRAEMNKLAKEMEETNWDSDKEKIEAKMYRYVQRAWLMQGLVDRTPVFQPIPVERLNIFKLEEYGNLIRFIYDDEAALPSGRKSFNDWWDDINSKIQAGSRVLLTGIYPYTGRIDRYDTPAWADRFYLGKAGVDGLRNVPDLPKEGVYEVDEFCGTSACEYHETDYYAKLAELESIKNEKKYKAEGVVKGRVYRIPDEKTKSKTVFRIRYFDKPELTIKYKPDDKVGVGWNKWDTHDRKNRTRFRIEKKDEFLINYDQITLEDIDFYLSSRVDRHNYLEMMPVLQKLRTHLIEEQKQEKHFVRFVADRNEKDFDIPRKQLETLIWKAIDWWKFKNQWKRAINKDDALALRMIERRIKNEEK